MKSTETLSHQIIGRIVSVTNPLLVQDIISNYAPLSSDRSLVPIAFEKMKELFPDLDRTDFIILFIAVIYRIYRPGSFLPVMERPDERTNQTVTRLPHGVRSMVWSLLGLSHPEEVNRYKHYAEPHAKNPRYSAKIKMVTDALGLTEKI